MRRIALILSLIVPIQLAGPVVWAQNAAKSAASASASASAPADPADELKQELEKLKKAVAALEERLKTQEKQTQAPAQALVQQQPVSELVTDVKDLDKRVSATEREQALDRLRITGDYRFEAHSIAAKVPAHFNGMALQNLVVKTMFAMPILGRPPASVAEINNTVAGHYSDYQFFTNNLTFDSLKKGMASFPAPLQQQLFGMLMPSTFIPAYNDNNDALFTNRLRLNIDAKVADNVSFTGRLSMYKVFGDSTGVQVFNGQPTSLNSDGSTTGVPNSDQLRVERAYFSWNNIGGSKLYLSIGRRPSTGGPPMNYRQDELRGGTPSGSLIDYQFDGITVGYKLSDNMVWRLCWGLGYESGFGNGNLLKMPQDRLKDSHFLGANLDLWNSETTLVQATYAHAFNVTDGFNGLMVLPANPLTGDPVNAPVVMRYTPSANLGGIHLFGMNISQRAKSFDFYGSGNFSATRPNGTTTPFGGLMSDPFETPVNRSGYMVLAGLRFNFANDERTKLGFEFNHGSQYWFNFAQAADDIIAPKTNTRGNVVETYLTHRINNRFIFKADFIKYLYTYSGSGWHVGAPKLLTSQPTLGFPSYSGATMFSLGLTARF
jgi:Protein of unknown function (DUF3373)